MRKAAAGDTDCGPFISEKLGLRGLARRAAA